jgi:hypothetical protein
MWLSALIEAMDKVASSTAKPPAADRKALANRLNLPAMRPPLGILIHPGNHRPADSAARAATRSRPARDRKDIPSAAGS